MSYKRFSTFLLYMALGISSFSCSKSYFAEEGFVGIHTSFNPNVKAALAKLEIEGLQYDIQLDTGEFSDIVLQKEVLDRILNKELAEPVVGYDIKGNRYESQAFRLPTITLGGYELNDILALEENPKFLEEGCVLWKGENEQENQTVISGRIGRGILQRHNLLMVLPNGLFFDVGIDKQSLLRDFIEVPCEMGSIGVVLSISAGPDVIRFLLDSGSNFSIYKLNESREIGQRLTIGDVDIGTHQLYPIDNNLNLPGFDGVLGIDFFMSYSVYLDFESRRVFIKRRYPPTFFEKVRGSIYRIFY